MVFAEFVESQMQAQEQTRTGFSIPEWCASLGLGRSTFYLLKAKPLLVKVGRRVIVCEAPDAWLKRMASADTGGRE